MPTGLSSSKKEAQRLSTVARIFARALDRRRSETVVADHETAARMTSNQACQITAHHSCGVDDHRARLLAPSSVAAIMLWGATITAPLAFARALRVHSASSAAPLPYLPWTIPLRGSPGLCDGRAFFLHGETSRGLPSAARINPRVDHARRPRGELVACKRMDWLGEALFAPQPIDCPALRARCAPRQFSCGVNIQAEVPSLAASTFAECVCFFDGETSSPVAKF